MPRRLSIALIMLAFLEVGEPAYALWNFAADHACCLAKPAAAEPSCHGMAEHDATPTSAVSFAAGHTHSDCAHDCCTKQRVSNGSAINPQAIAIATIENVEIVVHANAETSPNARWSSLSERGPPSWS